MSWFCFKTSSANRKQPTHAEDLHGLSSSRSIRLFNYSELVFATNNFDRSNKIGLGGFGVVFKGTLKDGTQIAAKVLSAMSKQGDNEFLTEINTISNIKHPNLVELIGCCLQGNSRILVYELLKNRSLDHALLGPDCERMFSWSKRSAICLGTARGLTFLHEEVEPSIVHRDIKASNILLDENFVPKIGDFGLAKLFPDNITHISTRVAGTTGYLAPEYASGGRLTKKVDIYSFGVLILEIVSGRSISRSGFTGTEKLLLEQAWQLYEERKLIDLVDPSLGEYPEDEVIKYIKTALFCTQETANRRPAMPLVLEMLSNNVILNESELTPTRLLRDVFDTRDGPNGTESGMKFKAVSSVASVHVNNSDPFFSEVVPR